MCEFVSVRARARACVRACVRVCVYIHIYTYTHTHTQTHTHAHAHAHAHTHTHTQNIYKIHQSNNNTHDRVFVKLFVLASRRIVALKTRLDYQSFLLLSHSTDYRNSFHATRLTVLLCKLPLTGQHPERAR